MRIGYSTGAIAPGDVPAALSILAGSGAAAVELSALRLAELGPLLAALPSLDLSAYAHVSVHAPSRFSGAEEPALIDSLSALPPSFPIVLHPDTVHDLVRWRPLAGRLCVENMDRRKPVGRTLVEIFRFFDALPEASFCFDVGHAHQVDRTMGEAWELIRALGSRLGQLHVSEVGSSGRHDPLSLPTVAAFRRIAAFVPEDAAVIVESPAAPAEIAAQMRFAAEAFAGPRCARPG
jgi:hypothetical protein